MLSRIKNMIKSHFIHGNEMTFPLDNSNTPPEVEKNKNNSVIFHAMTAYQLLLCATEKLLNLNDKNGILIISKFLTTIYKDYERLISLGIFNKILIYDIDCFSKGENEQEVERKIIEYFDELLKSENISLDECEEIHISAAHHGFALYCAHHHRNFYFYEEAAGMLSQWTMLSDFEKNLFPYKHALSEKIGLFDGSSKFILECRCVIEAQHKEYTNQKMVNYELIDKLSLLSTEAKSKLITFFEVPESIPFKGDVTLLLGQQLYYKNKYMNSEESVLTYQYLIEYFTNHENIVIKPHPADKSNYSDYINSSYVFKTNFPSELLFYIEGIKYGHALTISSTSIFHFEKHINRNSYIGYSFLDFLSIINRCNVAFQLIKQIRNTDSPIYHYNIDQLQMDNFVEFVLKDNTIRSLNISLNEIPTNSICLINLCDNSDNLSISDIIKHTPENTILVFLPSYEMMREFDSQLFDNIVPICITSSTLTEQCLVSPSVEMLYVYCSNQDTLNQVSQFKYNQDLEIVGLNLSASTVPIV